MTSRFTIEDTSALSVSLLRAEEAAEWDTFALAHPLGSPFHLTAWKKSIEETFRYTPLYLLAREYGRVAGVLPLFLVKNPLVKRALISVPFAVYGGVLARSGAARESLRERLHALAHEHEVQYVELRNAHAAQCLGFDRIARYVTFTQEIGPDEDALLEAIPRKTRRMVRKALQQGFSTTRVGSASRDFLDLYLRNLQRLGTPAFPEKYFSRLLENFGSMADVREVVLNGKTVAAVLSFYFRDQVLPYYGASDPAASAAAPNNYMYYDLMRWAGCNGFRVFDFGRSKKEGSGSYDFKAHWGMLERELPYEMLLVKRKELPHYSPNNPKFRLFMAAWRRMPYALTRRLGPPLVRLVP